MCKAFKSIGAPALVAAAILALTAGAPAPALAQCGSSVTVSPGDTLYRIAQRCGTTVSALLDANPGIDSPNTIYAGQRIRMPGTVAGRLGPRRRAFAPAGERYRVRPGDTLYAISRMYGVPVSVLLRFNPHINPRFVPVGVIIRLPGDRDRPRDDDGLISVTGVITGEGVECPAMRGRDGRLYTLAGDIGGFGPGDRVRVRGRLAEVSNCMQGTTINVRRIRPAAAG